MSVTHVYSPGHSGTIGHELANRDVLDIQNDLVSGLIAIIRHLEKIIWKLKPDNAPNPNEYGHRLHGSLHIIIGAVGRDDQKTGGLRKNYRRSSRILRVVSSSSS